MWVGATVARRVSMWAETKVLPEVALMVVWKVVMTACHDMRDGDMIVGAWCRVI